MSEEEKENLKEAENTLKNLEKGYKHSPEFMTLILLSLLIDIRKNQ